MITENKTELDRLLAIRQAAREELDAASARYQQAEDAVLEERCRDLPRFAVGDVILVPRKLFGRTIMWPARIDAVSLHYSEGHWAEGYAPDPGGHWETRYVSYSVFLQQKDGEYGGGSVGFYHKEVAPYVPPADG